MSGVIIEPKSTICFHCDFDSGQREMDRCHHCDGTGSLLWAGKRAFPNTKEGYRQAVYVLNDPEHEREEATKCPQVTQ